MHRYLLVMLAFALIGCPEDDSGGLLPDDDDAATDDDDDATDDDDIAPDDDDIAPDDDDIAPDDDDTTPDDDDDIAPDDDDTAPDDDDTAPDDDDTAPDDDDDVPDPTALEATTYCLDWSTVTFTEPPNLASALSFAGIAIEDYPLLVNPTSIDTTLDEIEMLVAQANVSTCVQNLAQPTADLTSAGPGTYVSPTFSVGPADFTITTTSAIVNIFGLEFSGDFALPDGASITTSTLTGEMDVTAFASFCGVLGWTCSPCPGAPAQTCVDLVVDNAVWNDNGLGPLTP